MEKIPFTISAAKQDSRALIRITGTIGWDTNAELFRSQVDGLMAQGVEDVHIYLNGPGGSCFDAAEIVNILRSSFTGKITGEGGALVASAYTYIAMHCDSFEMPENGMFMIHQVRGGGYGTTGEVEAALELLRKTDTQFYKIYEARATDTAELKKQWEAGDWWMTAKEALDNGFITSVKAPIHIDRQASAMLVACGCPQDKVPINNIKIKNEMDLKTMAKTLGLPENATEEQVNAAIEQGRKARTDLMALQAENERKEKEARTKRNKDLVKAALDGKCITADMVAFWEEALEENFERNSKLLASLQPVVKIDIKHPAGGLQTATGPATYAGKTFEQLQDESPEILQGLLDNDQEAYDALYNDFLKRNKLNK